jgi:hypothetical protein
MKVPAVLFMSGERIIWLTLCVLVLEFGRFGSVGAWIIEACSESSFSGEDFSYAPL